MRAALPLLLLFEIYQRPVGTVLTGEAVGEEIFRILVGAIALVLAVPVTTAIGALLATSAAPRRGHRPHPGSADGERGGARVQPPAYGAENPEHTHVRTSPAMPAVPPRRVPPGGEGSWRRSGEQR